MGGVRSQGRRRLRPLKSIARLASRKSGKNTKAESEKQPTSSTDSDRSDTSNFEPSNHNSRPNQQESKRIVDKRSGRTPCKEVIVQDGNEEISAVSGFPSGERPGYQVQVVVDRQASLSSRRRELERMESAFDILWDTIQSPDSYDSMSDDEVILFKEDTKLRNHEEDGIFSYSTWVNSEFHEHGRKKGGLSFHCQNRDQVQDLVAENTTTTPRLDHLCAVQNNGSNSFQTLSPMNPPNEIAFPADEDSLNPRSTIRAGVDAIPGSGRQVEMLPGGSQKVRGTIQGSSHLHPSTLGVTRDQGASSVRISQPQTLPSVPNNYRQSSFGGKQFSAPPMHRVTSSTSTHGYTRSLFDTIVDSPAPMPTSNSKEQEESPSSSKKAGLLDPPGLVPKVVKAKNRPQAPVHTIKVPITRPSSFQVEATARDALSVSSSLASTPRSPRFSRRRWIRSPFHVLNRRRDGSMRRPVGSLKRVSEETSLLHDTHDSSSQDSGPRQETKNTRLRPVAKDKLSSKTDKRASKGFKKASGDTSLLHSAHDSSNLDSGTRQETKRTRLRPVANEKLSSNTDKKVSKGFKKVSEETSLLLGPEDSLKEDARSEQATKKSRLHPVAREVLPTGRDKSRRYGILSEDPPGAIGAPSSRARRKAMHAIRKNAPSKIPLKKHSSFMSEPAIRETDPSPSPSVSSSSAMPPRRLQRKWLRRPFHLLNQVREQAPLPSPQGPTVPSEKASRAVEALLAPSLLEEEDDYESSSQEGGLTTNTNGEYTEILFHRPPPTYYGQMRGMLCDPPGIMGAPSSLELRSPFSVDYTEPNTEIMSNTGELTVGTLRFADPCRNVGKDWGLAQRDEPSLGTESITSSKKGYLSGIGHDIAATVEELGRESSQTFRWLFRWRKIRL